MNGDPDGLELIEPEPPVGADTQSGVPYSPDAFKENVAPRQPLSGGKTRSPGLSPLGRKKVSRRADLTRDLPPQPETAGQTLNPKSRTPKRTLNFGTSMQDAEDGNRFRVPQAFPAQPQGSQQAHRQVQSPDAESGIVCEQSDAFASLNLTHYSPPAYSPPVVRLNEDMLAYDFSEDGDPVASEFIKVDTNLSIGVNMDELNGRTVLGELERMKIHSPPQSQTEKKGALQCVEDSPSKNSPSKKSLRCSKTLFKSQPNSPVKQPIRI